MASARPVHPLFAGGDAKNALAAAAAQMKKNRGDEPPPADESYVEPAPAAPPAATPKAPPPAARPPHPLFGGGGGDKSALNEQIKMRAEKRNQRMEAAGPPPEPEKKKKSIEQVMPPGQASKIGAQQSASLADQVAMMAARRAQRMKEAESGNEDTNTTTPTAEAAVPVPAPVAPTPKSSTTTTSRVTRPGSAKAAAPVSETVASPKTPPAQKETDENGKNDNASFGRGKKADPPASGPAPAAPARVVRFDSNKKNTPVASNSAAAPTDPAAPHAFNQVKLRPVNPSNKENTETNTPGTRTLIQEEMPGEMTTTTTSTTRTTVTKKVTKHEPEYEMTEYKCLCNIL